MIVLVNDNILRSRLARVADFYATKGENTQLADPPLKVVKDILALGEWNLPPLVSLVESPVLRPDGTVLSESGYDHATGLYLHPTPGLFVDEIPENPTAAQIKDALELLQEVIEDFPFADDASRANMLALLLTPIVRPAINGNVPLALIDAPQAGTGKSLLGDIAAIIATGYGPTLMPYSRDTEEWRKKITSALMADASVIVVDNITAELNSEILASALTTREWGDRLLGKNEIVRLPQLATWVANGNNIRLGGDLPRRCYLIRLDAEMSRPWQRSEFRHPNLVEWVEANRGCLISAALTLARAWVVAGMPAYHGPTVGGFTEWANVVGGILENAGVDGFLGNVESMYDSADEEGVQWEAFLLALHEHFSDRWVRTQTICEALRKNRDLADLLPDKFDSPFDYYGEVTEKFRRKFGIELRKRVNTRFGSSQVYIRQERDSHRKVAKWQIVCGDAGTCGVSTTLSQNQVTSYSLITEGEINPAIPANPAELGKCYSCGESAWVEHPEDIGGGVYCAVCHPLPGLSIKEKI
jgi:hypothetical protein